MGIAELCELAITCDHINPCVAEHIVVVLCLILHTRREEALRVFMLLMANDYKYGTIAFLIDLLEGAQYVSVKARRAGTSKRAEPLYELSTKLTSPSMSSAGKALSGCLSDHDNFSAGQDQADPAVKGLLEHFRDKLLAGAVQLLGVCVLQLKKSQRNNVPLLTILEAYAAAMREGLVSAHSSNSQ